MISTGSLPPIALLLVVFLQEPAWDDLRVRFLEGDAAAHAAYVAAGADAVPHLAAIMNDEEAGTAQFLAANVMGELGLEACVDPLLEGLDHPWFNVRRCAALALARTGSERAREPLRELASSDPFVWTDRETGQRLHLVREAAREALATLDEIVEVFLDDASVRPPLDIEVPRERCRWPFPGDFAAQNVFNNYQQPTDGYVHAALDLMQPAGTPVRAVASGRVALVATNYPDWTTHHFFIVEPEPGASAGRGEGWCYTHVDPATYTFEVGDDVEAGEVLGDVVAFSLGDRKGADHLHLHYVAFEVGGDGKVAVHGLYDPLLRFEWEDEVAPTVHGPLRFVRPGTLEPVGPELSGRIAVLATISDAAHARHGSAWMVPVVTVEIVSDSSASSDSPGPWRKLVLDQRGPIENARVVRPLHLPSARRGPLVADLPRFPRPYVLDVTATDGDGVIEEGDRKFCWDTAAVGANGLPRFPDGGYEVVVRAWDLAGNRGEARARVRVVNGR